MLRCFQSELIGSNHAFCLRWSIMMKYNIGLIALRKSFWVQQNWFLENSEIHTHWRNWPTLQRRGNLSGHRSLLDLYQNLRSCASDQRVVHEGEREGDFRAHWTSTTHRFTRSIDKWASHRKGICARQRCRVTHCILGPDAQISGLLFSHVVTFL